MSYLLLDWYLTMFFLFFFFLIFFFNFLICISIWIFLWVFLKPWFQLVSTSMFILIEVHLILTETLVHSTLEPCDDADFSFTVNFNLEEHTVYVRCRPHLREFMDRLSGLFEIIIFTASQSIYAEKLLNVLDPLRKVFRHRVYRESCVFVDGNYLKDLSVLGRDLAHVIIIDNSPQVLLLSLPSRYCF